MAENFAKAYLWFNLGATKGQASTAKSRNLAAAQMNAVEIADAQKMARDCLARAFKGCN